MEEVGSAVGSFLLLPLVIAAASDFTVLIFAMSTEYGDLGFVLAFGVRVVVVLGASSLGGDEVGRKQNLPLDMMSFQLDVFSA